MKSLKSVLKYALPYKVNCALNVVGNLFSTIFELFTITMIIPFLDLIFNKSINEYQTYVDAGQPPVELSINGISNTFYYYFSKIILDPEFGKMDALVFLCSLIVSMIFLKNVFRFGAMYIIAPVRIGVIRDIRNKIYKKVLNLPLGYYSEKRKGDIIARVSNDVMEVEWTILTSLEMLFKDPFKVIFYIGCMVVMSPELTIFVFILLPVAGFLIGRIGKSLNKVAAKSQSRLGYLISIMEETLGGLRIIKGFNGEQYMEAKFQGVNEEIKKLMITMYRKKDLASPMSEFLAVTVLSCLIWFGGQLVLDENGLSASVFIAFIAIFSQVIPPAKALTTAYYNLQRGSASVERIEKILKVENTIVESDNAKTITLFNHSIEYKNIQFKYEVEEVLKDVSLKIEKGKSIALVGPSGGGKSTLADLLPRFYDPNQGEILIDGENIANLKINNLRNLLGIVTQDSILFNDSVYNNIVFGAEGITQEEVESAAKIANAHDFIMEMDGGYQSNIGDGGQKLSGGQRQRLSIARAVLKNPPILILDEATSALDTESERLVQDALNNLMKNRTSLVIAHRLSTIKNANEIVVIDKGEIKERGTHEELLLQAGVYKKLHELQTFS